MMIFRDFSDFSIAGNNWKKNLIIMKNEKKKMVQNLDGYCPFELKAGLGVLGAGLGVQGAQAVGRAVLGVLGEHAQGAGTRHGQARRQAGAGRARGRRAAVALGRAGGRGAQALGRQALGRWGVRTLAGTRARGRASGREAGRTVRAGHDRQTARARSLCARAGPAGPGWGFVHSDSVFLARFDSVVSRVTK